jgi:gliding motility-associated-like protein
MMRSKKNQFKLLIFICLLITIFFRAFSVADVHGTNINKKITPPHLLKLKYTGLNNAIVKPLPASCSDINWAVWSNFRGESAVGTINDDTGNLIDITMTSNFPFSSTPSIYRYNTFSGYPSAIPNSTVPETTWAEGPGGTTTMCFSQTVTNPVLLLSSLGSSAVSVLLSFSQPYVVLYDGGGMQYNTGYTLTGTEGYAIIMFPGDLSCVTINSTTPEFYTNITWGIRPPPFSIAIVQTVNACGSATLTASGGVSYLWNGGDTPNQPTNTFHQSGTYIVTVTDAGGCSTSASKAVIVSPPPVATITGNLTGCGSVTLTAGGGVSYLWDGGNSPNSATNTFNTSGTYNVTVTDAGNCTATTARTVTITPDVSPSVSITDNPSTSICSGSPVSFTATMSNGGTSPLLQWFRNGSVVASGQVYTATDLKNDDTIVCRLTSNVTCAVPATVTSNAITMAVNSTPTITFTQNIITTVSTPVQLNPVINGSVASYLWSPATGLSDPTIKNPIANPQVNTNYLLTVVSPQGCKAADSVMVTVLKKDITIPNTFTPNGDGINDTWDIVGLSNYMDATIDIYNRYGEHLFHSIGYSIPWDGTYNGKRLPVGTYYYIIDFKYNNYPLRSGWVAILR